MAKISKDKNQGILKKDYFCDSNFSKLELDNVVIQNKTFENCCFSSSSFIEATISNCKFIDCEFESCNLSIIQFKSSFFSDTVFRESKLIGVNWTQIKWPYTQLSCPIKFYSSDISNSSFYGLKLSEIAISECKAKDVDFRECDLSNGDFTLTDFENSLFMHTNLCSADFTDAVNYRIDPNENNISKGKYSFPEVINLLNDFEIEIEGI